MKKVIILIMIVALFTTVAFTGTSCKKEAAKVTAGATTETEATTEAAPEESTIEPKELKIASLLQPSDNPWVVNNIRFQELVAKALGIDLVVVNDEGTEDSNIARFESMIAMAPDAIMFDPITEAAGVRDAALLEENQIYGITEDRLVVNDISEYEGEYLIAQVTFDLEKWGYDMMMSLINQGATKIAAIMDPKGVTTVEMAWEGALKAVDENPGVEIIQESWQPKSRENGIETMERYLTAYGPGEIDGVYVFGSTVGLGAFYAIEQAGREDEIKVSTCDIDYDVLDAINGGDLASSSGAHWMVGGYALIMLYDFMNGFEPEDRQPNFRLITVNKENGDKYKATFLDSLPYNEEEVKQLSKVYNPDADLVSAIENLALTWDK